MTFLSDSKISLRAIEPQDIDTLYSWENDEKIWTVGDTLQPFSKYILMKYIENAANDISETGQLRLMIDSSDEKKCVGMVDLFNIDMRHLRAGVGIMIHSSFRKKGYATHALDLMIRYAFEHLFLHQLYCNIGTDNETSLKLFQNAGFKIIGLQKEWMRTKKGFSDVYLLQLINRE